MPGLAQSLTTPDATAVVQAEQDTRRKFGGCGSHAEAGPALKVVQEGLRDLVQDLIRGLDSYTEGLRTLPRQIRATSGGGSGLAGSSYFSLVPLPDGRRRPR
jgi:hypothetical protein